jgi:hypothetical protein
MKVLYVIYFDEKASMQIMHCKHLQIYSKIIGGQKFL